MESRQIIGIFIAVVVIGLFGWWMSTPAPVTVGVYSDTGTYDTGAGNTGNYSTGTYDTGAGNTGNYSTGTYDTGLTGTDAPVVVAPPSLAGSYKIVRAPGSPSPPRDTGVLIIEATASGGFKAYESTKPDRYDLGTQTGSAIIFAPPPGNGGLGPGIKTFTQTQFGATLSVPGENGFATIIPLERIK